MPSAVIYHVLTPSELARDPGQTGAVASYAVEAKVLAAGGTQQAATAAGQVARNIATAAAMAALSAPATASVSSVPMHVDVATGDVTTSPSLGQRWAGASTPVKAAVGVGILALLARVTGVWK